MTSQLDDILAAVGAAPCLPGARCRGRHALFDPAAKDEDPDNVTARHTQALTLCTHCPSLTRCKAWLDGLPVSKRPFGVIAGTVRIPR
jgi:hypothetical protein